MMTEQEIFNAIGAYLFLCEGAVDPVFHAPLESNEWTLEQWLAFDREYAVTEDDYRESGRRFTGAILYVLDKIAGDTDEELQKFFYDAGNTFYGKENLRQFFKDIYWMLTGKPDGPRIGKLVNIWGVEEFRAQMRKRMLDPLGEIHG